MTDMASSTAQPRGRHRRWPPYHGWWVVGGAFLIAFFGWGFGFYGPGIYLVALAAQTGVPLDRLAPAVTVYYLIGAGLLLAVAHAYLRFGPRPVVLAGAFVMTGGVILLSRADQAWQVYAGFAVLALGWASLSGAAVNIIIAPWFTRRRGAAVSLALNGASAGGIVLAPVLIALIGRVGFTIAVALCAGAMLLVLAFVALLVLRPRRADEHEPGAPLPAAVAPTGPPRTSGAADDWPLSRLLRHGAFLTIAVSTALALLAQVGFLTHQVAYLTPLLGVDAVGWAVSATTIAAVVGRVVTGLVVDRVDRRLAAAANLLLQVGALGMLFLATSPFWVLLGCVLFGLGIGNVITLPGLIVQQEFPVAQFARLVSLITAIGQVTFAFGPGLLGYLRTPDGGYGPAILACLLIDLAAAVIVAAPALRRRRGGVPA